MTDKEIFERFMGWMGMTIGRTKILVNGDIAMEYTDTQEPDKRFTVLGYDEFDTGAIFDKDGAIVKSYIDSHVAFTSKNNKFIFDILNKNKQ